MIMDLNQAGGAHRGHIVEQSHGSGHVYRLHVGIEHGASQIC